MLDDDINLPFRVTDLKQWVYCPRVYYYHACLPKIRPTTFKMKAGVEAGEAEEGREERRSLKVYGIEAGEREYNVPVRSLKLGLRGEIDMVITVAGSGEVIPVDYKLSQIPGLHFRLQVAAYGMMLEEIRKVVVQRAFLYSIPNREAEEVQIDKQLTEKLTKSLVAMREVLEREKMPAPTTNLRKCVSCEFRRFCNDVL